MKSVFVALCFLAFAVCANAQTPLYPIKYTVATLPAAGTMKDRIVSVTDSLTQGDCAIGGGTLSSPCRSNGTAWVPWGDGTGPGSSPVSSVSGVPPINSSGGSTPAISIDNAAADGSTKGAASFTAADFNSSSGNISIDYTNGQAADSTHKGFLTSTDWSTFNGKEAAGIDLRIANNLSDLGSASAARGNLGGTTVGQNLFTLTNPSAVTWLRVNADNSVSPRSAAQTLSDIGAQASGNYLVDCGSNGFLARSALNTTVCRTLTGTSNRLTITNTTGGGDPVFNIPDAAQLNVAKLLNLTTNGPVYLSGGDGTLNSEAVVNSVRGGTGVNNAGTITNASNTTITGGGTLALAGFTFTVPATGTGVLTFRTITEGNGLAGNTYDLSANRTLALGTPSTLTVATSNALTSTSHTHAITSSSNPGAAASLLASNSSGYLQLVRLGIGGAPSQPLEVVGNAFINAATANLFMKDTSTGWQVSTSAIINPQSGNLLRNTSFAGGVSGWSIADGGNSEFNNITARGEFRASVFKVSEITATAGTFGVFYSASTLNTAATTPGALLSAFVFDAKNSDALAPLFALGDSIRIKAFNGATIVDAWADVQSLVNHSTYTTYTTAYRSGSTSVNIPAGAAVVDYGPSGAGFITLSSDGTVGASPNITMGTHAGTPWTTQTLLSRLGNLNGSYGYATDVQGFGVGSYGVSGQPWLTVETTNGIRIGNNTTVLGQWDTSGNIVVGQVASGQSNVRISSGALDLRNNTTARIHLASDGSGYLANSLIAWDTSGNLTVTGNATIAAWTIGATRISSTHVFIDEAGEYLSMGATPPTSYGSNVGVFLEGANSGRMSLYKDANNYLQWDNSKLIWKGANTSLDASGNLTVNAGLIGGWTVNSTYLAKDTGTNSTSAGLAPTDYPFFAGATYANRASAAFRVTPAGVVTASSGNVIIDSFGVNIRNGAFQTINPGFTTYDGIFLGSSGDPTNNGYSSRLRMEGTGGNGGVDSVLVDWIQEVQGSFRAGPLVWSTSYNGGSYQKVMSLGSNSTASGGLSVFNYDASTSSMNSGLLLAYNSSGTPAANFGNSILFQLQSSTTADQNAARIGALWTTATHASRTSALVIQTVNNAGSLAEVGRFAGNGDFTITGLLKAGSGPTTLTGATGKILDAALSANIPLLNATAQFTGTNVEIAPATNTDAAYFKATNAGGSFFYGLDNSAHSAFGTVAAYTAVLYNGANTAMTFWTNATLRATIGAAGGLTVGSPTGGNQGAGTINAQAVYDDSVLLTDWVLTPGGKPDVLAPYRRLFALDETRRMAEIEHRLPWMPTPSEFESARGLGGMVTRLWQGQEQQQLYIFDLESSQAERIKALERRIADLEKRRN
jgi:hypothetical protein